MVNSAESTPNSPPPESSENQEKSVSKVEVFGKEVLSKEDVSEMQSGVKELLLEQDPKKQLQSMYDGVKQLTSLKQIGIKANLSERVIGRMKNAIPHIAERDPKALGQYLNRMQYLGVIKKEDITPEHKEILKKDLNEYLNKAVAERPANGEPSAYVDEIAQRATSMKAIGMEIPDAVGLELDAKLLHESSQVINSSAQDGDEYEQHVFGVVKSLAQLQYLSPNPDAERQSWHDNEHAEITGQVDELLKKYQQAGEWKKYARMRNLYGMYAPVEASPTLETKADNEVQTGLTEHVSTVKQEKDTNKTSNYIADLRRIERSVQRPSIENATNEPSFSDIQPETQEKQGEFEKLAKEAAKKGWFAAYSSWSSGKYGGRDGYALGWVYDPRAPKFLTKFGQDSNSPDGEKTRLFNISNQARTDAVGINEIITLNKIDDPDLDSDSPGLWAINYRIDPRAGTEATAYGVADHTGRTTSLRARMYLPEPLAKEIFQAIQESPQRIRDLLSAFDMELHENHDQPELLKQIHFPRKEARVLIAEEEDIKKIFTQSGINEDYIHSVDFSSS